MLGYSLLKNLNTNLILKTFNRGKRFQRRQAINVFNSYEEAAKAELKQKVLKEELRKKPDFKQFFQQKIVKKQQQPPVAQSNDREIYEKLQNEANRIVYKHDPYLQHDKLSSEAIEDVKQNVDVLAAKLAVSEDDSISKIMKLPDGDSRFGPAIQIAKSLRHRYEKKKILLEGKRLIMDALNSGVKIESIFFSKDTQIKQFDFDFASLNYQIKFYQVSPKSINLWSDVETSQGFLAIAKMPAPGDCKLKRTVDLPLLLVLDQVRDPGNMGTIIRSAAAIGVEKILVTKASVDIWDPKVIRSAMGGHFRVPIIHDVTYDQIVGYLPENTRIIFADNPKPNDKTPKTLKKIDYTGLKSLIGSNQHTVLIVGGETHGINPILYASTTVKVKKNDQAIVNIPLENGVESLNCGIAFTVLGYELKRLILTSNNE